MNVEQFNPFNDWEINPNIDIIDKQSNTKYAYRSKDEMRAFAFVSIFASIPAHVVIGTAFVGLRILKLISFWHFWKPLEEPYSFQARLLNASNDLLKIFTQPFILFALEFVSFYGLFRPYDAQKLYCSLEQYQYDQPIFTEWLKLSPIKDGIQNDPIQPEENPEPEVNPPPKPKPENQIENPAPRVDPQPPSENPHPVEIQVENQLSTEEIFKNRLTETLVTINEEMNKNPRYDFQTPICSIILSSLPAENSLQFANQALAMAAEKLKEIRIRLPASLTIEHIALKNELLIKEYLAHGENSEQKLYTMIKPELTKLESALNTSSITLKEFEDLLRHWLKIFQLFPSAGKIFEKSLASIGNMLQDKYIQGFQKAHEELFALPSGENFKDPNYRFGQLQQLSELIYWCSGEKTSPFYGENLAEGTQKQLFSIKLERKHFLKIINAETPNLLHASIANAILAIEDSMNQNRLNLSTFAICCSTIISHFSKYTNNEIVCVEKNDDFISFIYLCHLRNIYNDIAAKMQKHIEGIDQVYLLSDEGKCAILVWELTSKIKILINTDIALELPKDNEDDHLISLLSEIVKFELEDKDAVAVLREWLKDKDKNEKEFFKVWLGAKIENHQVVWDPDFSNLSDIDHLDDLYNKCTIQTINDRLIAKLKENWSALRISQRMANDIIDFWLRNKTIEEKQSFLQWLSTKSSEQISDLLQGEEDVGLNKLFNIFKKS